MQKTKLHIYLTMTSRDVIFFANTVNAQISAQLQISALLRISRISAPPKAQNL